LVNSTSTNQSKSPTQIFKSWRLWLAVIGTIVLLTFPVVNKNDYILRIVIWVIIDTPLALSQNLITGFTGLLTLGQAAFYGIGAYTSALLVMRLGIPWPVAFLAAGAVACLFGIALSIPCLRVGSDYLTLMTISFGEIFYIVALNWDQLTRGPLGIPGVTPPQIGPFIFASSKSIFYLYLCISAVCYLFMHRLTHSHIGRALIAIRDNETAAAAMGIDVRRYKTLAFACGTMWAGISGSMLAHFLNFVGPQTFTLNESIMHMQMAILGGLGSLPGSILGALILISLPQLFQPIYKYQVLLNGLLMVILLTWRPQGILGKSATAKATRKNIIQMFFGKRVSNSKNEKVLPLKEKEILDTKRGPNGSC
jgi:branched-chain amino acid transport system permease protein